MLGNINTGLNNQTQQTGISLQTNNIFGNISQPQNSFPIGQQPQPNTQIQQQPQGIFGQQQQQPPQNTQTGLQGMQQTQGGLQLGGLTQQTGIGNQPQQQQQQQQQGQVINNQLQPQQPQQQQQQQQQPKQYSIQQIKTEAQKHIDNLSKAILNKEKIEKNQKNLLLIEKNSLKNIQQQQQKQQPQQSTGLLLQQPSLQNTQQQQKPPQKIDQRNHTGRVEKFYAEWNRVIQRINQKQAETLSLLSELNAQLTQQEAYYEIDEESLIDSVKQLGKELDSLETKIVEVLKLQEKILGLEKEETEWDQIMNNLSECLMLLEQQTKDVEDSLVKAETHPKVVNR